jgi:hypothetical protein
VDWTRTPHNLALPGPHHPVRFTVASPRSPRFSKRQTSVEPRLFGRVSSHSSTLRSKTFGRIGDLNEALPAQSSKSHQVTIHSLDTLGCPEQGRSPSDGRTPPALLFMGRREAQRHEWTGDDVADPGDHENQTNGRREQGGGGEVRCQQGADQRRMDPRGDLPRETTEFKTSGCFARRSSPVRGSRVIEGKLEALSGRNPVTFRRNPWHWRDRTPGG